MTSKRKFKKLVRAHAEQFGLSYTAALRSFLTNPEGNIEMKPAKIDLEALLQSASVRATTAGLNWVGVEHILLVLAEAPDNEGVAEIVNHIEEEIRVRKPANKGWETMEATVEFVRLAQLLTFQEQFALGDRSLSAATIVDAIVQDNPTWRLSRLLRK